MTCCGGWKKYGGCCEGCPDELLIGGSHERPETPTERYERGVDPMPVGVYAQNGDGTYSPAQPLGWQEEHNRLARFILWIRGIEHCNDQEGQRRKRWFR